MKSMMQTYRRLRSVLLLGTVFALMVGGVLWQADTVHAAATVQLSEWRALPSDALSGGYLEANQVFQGDLRVESGQTISGDAVVYDGDVVVESEGRITGNLVVFRGDVVIEAGGVVEGNLDHFSGDLDLAGVVNGNLAVWNGDIALRDSATVGGNISLLNGDIHRDSGAQVGGNVVQGPRFGGASPRFIQPFGFDFGSVIPRATEMQARPVTFLQWFGAFLARLLGAVLLTGFMAVVVGLISHVRPDAVERVRNRIVAQPAMSFVIGLAANLILIFMGSLLAITVCLLPIALVPMLGLLALNVLGWAALSQWLGRWVASYAERPIDSGLAAALGAVAITGFFALLWAFGGFFRFAGGTMLLLVASFGAGAVLLPWVMRGLQSSRSPRIDSPQDGVGAASAIAPAGEVKPRVYSHPAPPVDVAPAQDPIDVAQAQDTVRDVPQEDVRVDAAPEPSTPVESTGTVPAPEDDFTELKGVGPVLDQRLKEAGIRTFGQLAELSAAEAAEILSWTEVRVTRSGLLEEAREAAQG